MRNDEVASIVKQLGDYLIIGGYPEQHAKRYAQLAHTIITVIVVISLLYVAIGETHLLLSLVYFFLGIAAIIELLSCCFLSRAIEIVNESWSH